MALLRVAVIAAVARALVVRPASRVGPGRPRLRVEAVQEPSAAEYAAVYGAPPARNCSAPLGEGLEAPLYAFNRGMIDAVKGAIDVVYAGRDYARFYVLETIARVPYFAYVSVLHLRESLGARDRDHVARMRVHYAEADNELHHLLIMEALGGNASAPDRALAQTLAFGYYWYVCATYAVNPKLAYHLSELIEDHAYDTYDDFLAEHRADLEALPAPPIAVEYYGNGANFYDLAVAPSGAAADRPPPPASLYDVFVRIRDDEKAHWETLVGLVQFDSLQAVIPPEPTRPCVVVGDACVVEGDDECVLSDADLAPGALGEGAPPPRIPIASR